MQRIVIVGGGFAGVWAALAAAEARGRARRNDVGITLISRDPWLTIRPRLYEGTLDETRVPLDDVLHPAGVDRVQGSVQAIDVAARSLSVNAPVHRIAYDRLVLAAGSSMHRSAIAGAEHAFSVDTYAEAEALRSHIEALPSPIARSSAAARYTAVVIGAGFTGIEVATALASRLRGIARDAGADDSVRVILVERGSHLVPDLTVHAREHVVRALAELRVAVRTGVAVRAVQPDSVLLDDGERISCATVICTSGLRASALASQLPATRDALGRVHVDECLRVPDVKGVFAAGDIAHVLADRNGFHVAPMSCQIAIPMGEVAGANVFADIAGKPLEPFAYPTYVTCLDLGKAGALFMEGWDREVRLTGFWAKLLKQTINGHLIYPPRAGYASRPWGTCAA